MAKDGGAKPRPTGKKASKSDERPQAERFIETARELGVDETGKTFEEAFAKVVPSRRRERKASDYYKIPPTDT